MINCTLFIGYLRCKIKNTVVLGEVSSAQTESFCRIRCVNKTQFNDNNNNKLKLITPDVTMLCFYVFPSLHVATKPDKNVSIRHFSPF